MAEMTKTKSAKSDVCPRPLSQSTYRYTIDEFLSRCLNYKGKRVFFYDTCAMNEYRYNRGELEAETIQTLKNGTMLSSIFESFAFIENNDEYLSHSTHYWRELVPGGKLLEFFVHDDNAMEWATSVLDNKHNRVFIDIVPLVHSLPLGAVRNWLKFVCRKFEDIPIGAELPHKPFPTTFM